MRTSALTGIFMLLVVIALAQNRWSMAFNTQLNTHTGSFTPLVHSEFINTHFEDPFNFSRTFSYGGGLSFDYELSKHWLGRTGINYLNTTAVIQEYSVYGGAHDLNTRFNNSKSNIYHQLQIPLSIIWQFRPSKFRPFLGGGLLFNRFFLPNNGNTVGLQQQVELVPERKSSTQWMINAGVSIQQKIGIELQYAFGTGDRVISYSEFLPFPCAAMAGVPLTGPCGNDYNAYSPSIFHSFLGLKISYYLLN